MNLKELFDLQGRVAIVTGGSMGLGKQMAEALADAGADLALCARKVEKCEETAAEISRSTGKGVMALKCDVSDAGEVQKMVDAVVEKFGRIDILVNNAGIAWVGSPEKIPVPDWEKVLKVNVTGVFLCSQAVGRVMIEQKQGKIINIASVAGLAGISERILDTISYNTSKGAVVNFTRDLAVKWAKYNINVNAIAPGFFPSHMTEWVIENRSQALLEAIPLGRCGGEDDLRGVVVFLASRASDYITGEVIRADGGLAM